MASRKKNYKLAKYNHLLKETSKLNNLLPEDRKLSLKELRELLSKKIYPQFKGVPKSKIGKRALLNKFAQSVKNIPAKTDCDPNLIDPEVYRSIDVFSIDEYLQQIIPNCIYVKVNGGEFGETKIFNTRNYSYSSSGVKNIIEKLREYADEISSDLEWSGVQQLRPKQPNDGKPENYYIEFILFIGGDPVEEKTTVRVKPKDKRQKKKSNDVTSIIRERINNLRSKKRKKTKLKKSVSKTAKQIKTAKKRITTSKTKKTKIKYTVERSNLLIKELNKLKRAYDKGLLNKQEYQRLKDRLSSEFEEGGEIN
jgi:hypothetical protein